MKLNDLTNEYLLIQKAIESSLTEDDLIADTEKLLADIEMDFDSKVLSLANYVSDMESKAEALKHKIAALKTRMAIYDSRSASVRDYIKSNMEAADKPKVEGLDYVVSVARNPVSLVIMDEEKLPSSYFSYKQERVIDKAAIKNDLKDGLFLDGAMLIQNTSLRIK